MGIVAAESPVRSDHAEATNFPDQNPFGPLNGIEVMHLSIVFAADVDGMLGQRYGRCCVGNVTAVRRVDYITVEAERTLLTGAAR